MQIQVKPSRSFSNELLEDFRQQGDLPADTVITSIINVAGVMGFRTLMRWLADPNDTSTNEQPIAVQDFFTTYGQLPAWANKAAMHRAMAFFQTHTLAINRILGLYSLPFSYLGANGAQVLWLTERIKNDTLRRLEETGEWVAGIHNQKEWQSEKAIIRTLKIRLVHASVRWFTTQSSHWQSSWGKPVNQEDMAGTNLAFSYVVLLGLRKMGISATVQEEEDYLHHINVVNYINGVTDELLPKNLREAYKLAQAISQRQFATSEAGIGLTRALLDAITSQVIQQNTHTFIPNSVRNLIAAEMRFFLGDQYADWLGIPNVAFEKRMVNLIGRLPNFIKQLPGL